MSSKIVNDKMIFVLEAELEVMQDIRTAIRATANTLRTASCVTGQTVPMDDKIARLDYLEELVDHTICVGLGIDKFGPSHAPDMPINESRVGTETDPNTMTSNL